MLSRQKNHLESFKTRVERMQRDEKVDDQDIESVAGQTLLEKIRLEDKKATLSPEELVKRQQSKERKMRKFV